MGVASKYDGRAKLVYAYRRSGAHSVAIAALMMIRPLSRSSSSSFQCLLFTYYLAAATQLLAASTSFVAAAQPQNCSDACLAEIAKMRLEDIKVRFTKHIECLSKLCTVCIFHLENALL